MAAGMRGAAGGAQAPTAEGSAAKNKVGLGGKRPVSEKFFLGGKGKYIA